MSKLTHEEFSRRGGQNRSARKLAAVRANIQKALVARWGKKPKRVKKSA